MTDRADKLLRPLRTELERLRSKLDRDPLANPVRRLSFELSQDIEAGKLSLDDTQAMIEALACEAASARKDRGAAYLAEAGSLKEVAHRLAASAGTADELADRLARPVETIVFTGHPTFAMRREWGKALRGEAPIEEATGIRLGITLAEEHEEARTTLARAADAVVACGEALIEAAEEKFGVQTR